MTVTVTFETDNAAFEDNFNLETRLILEQAWEKLLNDKLDTNAKLRDSNGNTVGNVEVK